MSFRPKRASEMRVYQRWTSDVIQKEEAVLLVLPVGGGKTVSALDAILKLIIARKVRRVLIIAPLRVAEEVWPEELQKWMHLWSLRYSVITGTAKGRLFALHSPADIYIINRENVPWLWKTIKSEDLDAFDMLVIDESTMLQDGKKRTPVKKSDGVRTGGGNLSRFGAVMNLRKRAKRVVELTGTVAPNGLRSLWGQIYALDYGARLGDTKEAFESRWFERDYMGFKMEPRKGAFDDIMGRVNDVVIAPDISEHIKKIPVQINDIKVSLTAAEMARYKKFERELYETETDIEAITQGVLVNKLAQFACGSLYDEGGKDLHVHDHKLHALEDLVEELNGEPLLIAYSYKFDLDRIRRRFKKAVVLNETPSAYKAWNRGEIQMLLAHPASAGHGLNLQFGGHNMVWYGFNWSLELYLQFNGRLPRTGQANDYVTMHRIIARGTIDETIIGKMKTTGVTQDEITSAVLRQLEDEYGAHDDFSIRPAVDDARGRRPAGEVRAEGRRRIA